MSAVAACLRLARRDALRAKGRSLLVIAMIAVPVMGVTTAEVLARTAQLDPEEALTRDIGAAQARLDAPLDGVPLLQRPDGSSVATLPTQGESTPAAAAPTPADLAALLPGSGRTLVDQRGTVTLRTAAGLAAAEARVLDYTDPLAAGLVIQRDGRAPVRDDEVAVTPRLLERAGLRLGGPLQLDGSDRVLTVVGTAVEPDATDSGEVFARPGAGLLAGDGAGTGGVVSTLLVGGPPVGWPEVVALNARGARVVSRAVVLDPPPRSAVPYYTELSGLESPVSPTVVTAGVLVAGMALLEVVLLAGPAFAVGTRRQRRQLALLAATGGQARHVAGVVLAGGLVLGLMGAVSGVLAGVALAAATRPALERLTDRLTGHFQVRPGEVALIAVVGLLTGVAAAVLPARAAARQDVVAVLAGRRGQAGGSRRTPVVAVVTFAVGLAIAAWGGYVRRDSLVILVGSALAELGVVGMTAPLVGFAARVGGRLPLLPRLALRDAARNRGRSAPAVAAILAAVSGSVAVSTYVASTDANREASYAESQWLPVGAAYLPAEETPAAVLPVAARALAAALPTSSSLVLSSVGARCTPATTCVQVSLVLPVAGQCPAWSAGRPLTPAERRDPRCTPPAGGGLAGTAVGGPEVLRTLAGEVPAGAAETLAAGGVVVFDPRYLHDGQVTLDISRGTGDDNAQQVVVPAVSVPRDYVPGPVLLSPALVTRLDLNASPAGVYARTTRLPTDAEEQAAQAAVADLGSRQQLVVERGFQSRLGAAALALLIGTAVVALGAAWVATGLAVADSRPDLATLAAVGASPRLRRGLAMAQSAVVAVLGSVLGLVVGLVPVSALLVARQVADPLGGAPFVLPWRTLAIILLGLPALAAVAAGAVTRSAPPLTRRLT